MLLHVRESLQLRVLQCTSAAQKSLEFASVNGYWSRYANTGICLHSFLEQLIYLASFILLRYKIVHVNLIGHIHNRFKNPETFLVSLIQLFSSL